MVLLVMSVILTLGLSAVSRSITDIRVSEQSQDSARAYWAAQAGLEKAILGQGEQSGEISDVTYRVTKTGLGGAANFVLPEKVSSGESFTYWLVEHDSSGQINAETYFSDDSLIVYFGNEGEGASSDTTPALIANLVYLDSGGSYQSKKYAFDPFLGRSPGTNFSPADSGSSFGGTEFAFKATISGINSLPLMSKPYYLNLMFIFNNASQPVGVSTGGIGISQGSCFESEAVVSSSNIVRKLSQCQTWSKNSEIFDYLLFSGGDLSQ